MVKEMPVWNCTGKTVTKAQAEKSLAAVKSACFGCDTHSSDCPIGNAADAVAAMIDEKSPSIRDLIHDQIAGALAGAKFPIRTPKALLEAFPNGADTTCCVGDLRMTAGESGKLLKASDFPFKNANAVADTIVERAGL